jgi:hypothetical protein
VPPTLLACPFCRELYGDEQLTVCPHCDVPLKPLNDLPPSYEVREAEAVEWERTPPQDRTLPWTYWQRGRGAVLILALVGLGVCFAPWIVMTKPQTLTLSAFDLSRTKGFWFGSSMVGWFVALPLVWTRRSITKLRGARVAAALFAVMPIAQVAVLAINAPSSNVIPVQYSWGWGFYASALIGLVALPFATRLGGSIDDLPADLGKELMPGAPPQTSDGQTLH